METATAIRNLGALVTFGMGLLGLLRPLAAAKLTSLSPVGALGVSEIRATYGGLFAALGGLALVSQESAAFLVAGVAWGGAAAGRVYSVIVDENRSGENLRAVAFEAAVALLLLFPS